MNSLNEDVFKINSSDYKSFHESMMRGNTGSSALHTFLSMNFTVLGAILCAVLRTRDKPLGIIIEYITIVLPLVFGHTVLAHYTYIINVCFFILLILLLYKIIDSFQFKESSAKAKKEHLETITLFRGTTYLITTFAILAVDFQIFPRHLAKTENYGYSLMDTGVGLFILISGLVHKKYSKNNFCMFMKDNAKLISVLLILGVSRAVSVKQLDYQEHVTEYGVHWNFFFTIAVTKCLAGMLTFAVPNENYYFVLSISITTLHELMLKSGLEMLVFSDAPRDTFLMANREGIISCMGYVAMYLFGAHIKVTLSDTMRTRMSNIKRLLLQSVILWILAYISNIISPTSRTLANAGYCLFLEVSLSTLISVTFFLETALRQKDNSSFVAPRIIAVVNDNGLLVFLGANVITGAINLSIHTMLVNNYIALTILNLYMIIVVSLAFFLKRIGLHL